MQETDAHAATRAQTRVHKHRYVYVYTYSACMTERAKSNAKRSHVCKDSQANYMQIQFKLESKQVNERSTIVKG